MCTNQEYLLYCAGCTTLLTNLCHLTDSFVQREAGLRLVRNDSDSVFETSASENESESSKPHPSPNVTPLAPADHHAMWYPTVRRTLLCLSKLYRCVERSTFEGLAFEALRECVKSLEKASAMITAKKVGSCFHSAFVFSSLCICFVFTVYLFIFVMYSCVFVMYLLLFVLILSCVVFVVSRNEKLSYRLYLQ